MVSCIVSQCSSSVKDKDDIDFDEFLENVKARQQSMSTCKYNLVPGSSYSATLDELLVCDAIISEDPFTYYMLYLYSGELQRR